MSAEALRVARSAEAVIAGLEAENAELAARVAGYENGVSWMTSCTSCAAVLDSCARETFARMHAEDRLGLAMGALSAALGPGGLTAVVAAMGELESPGLPDDMPPSVAIVLRGDLRAALDRIECRTIHGAPADAIIRLMDAAGGAP